MSPATKLFLAATALVGATSAASVPRQSSSTLYSNTFRLALEVVFGDTRVNGLELTLTSDTSGCWADVIVAPQGTNGTIFYTSDIGVATDLIDPSGWTHSGSNIVVTPGGTATVPGGTPIRVFCNPDEVRAGVAIASDSAAPAVYNPTLQFNGSDTWMLCQVGVLIGDEKNDDDAVLYYLAPGQRPYEGCSVVRAYAVCAAGTAIRSSSSVECQPSPF